MGKRTEYLQKLKAQLDDLSTQIELLEIRAKQADLSIRIKLNDHIRQLKEKREDAARRLSELHDASDEALETLKAGSESIWDTMKSTLHEVKSKFDKLS